jgi:hypothetical protein
MNHLQIDARELRSGALKNFVAGTLIMVPTETSSASGPFWALRFDTENEDGIVPSVLWLNGMPWHGTESPFYGMPLGNSSYGDMRGIAGGVARIEVDMSSGAGRAGREMRWDQSPGFIAVSDGGSFLLAEKPGRSSIWGAHYAIDLGAWNEVVDAHRDAPVEWFSRWNVVIDTARGAQAMPFDARSKGATRGA